MSAMPLTILSSHVGAGILCEGWNLSEPGPEESRSYEVEVEFLSPFGSAPVVHLGLTGFDSAQDDSPRISLKTKEITEAGFIVEISTWASTRVYSVEFSWLAIGS